VSTTTKTVQPSITLVQYPGLSRKTTLSAPCGKVHMALAFKGLDYTIRNVSNPAAARRFNPRGRVPVLILGNERIVDSTDILTALEERFPEPALQPADPLLRARGKILEDWADEVLYFYLVWLRWLVPGGRGRIAREYFARHYPPVVRSIAAWIGCREIRRRLRGQGVALKDEATVRRETSECLDALEAILAESRFLVGESCTRADIAVYSVVAQMRERSLTPELADEIDRRLELATWCDRVALATDPARQSGLARPESSGRHDVPPGAGVMAH